MTELSFAAWQFRSQDVEEEVDEDGFQLPLCSELFAVAKVISAINCSLNFFARSASGSNQKELGAEPARSYQFASDAQSVAYEPIPQRSTASCHLGTEFFMRPR